MKRIAIADVHLSGFQSDVLDKDGLPIRLSTIISSLKFVCEYAIKHSIENIDVLGDLINDKSIIYNDAQNAFADILIQYSNLIFTLISGNHDWSSTGQNQSSAISVFAGYPNVQCVTSPVVDGNISMVPFSKSVFDDMKEMESSDILLSHIGLSEAMLQSGISIIQKIGLGGLRQFKLALLGHYHRPQEINNQVTRLFYIGSLCHLNWNDKNELKRFIVYDTETLKVESVYLNDFMEYREYVLIDKEHAQEVLEEAEKAKNFGHKVRVKKMFEEEIDTPSDLVVIEKPKDVDVTNRGVDISQSKSEQFKKYMEIREIPEDQRDEYLNILTQSDVVKIN